MRTVLFAMLPGVVLLDVAGAAEAFRSAEREAPGSYQLRFGRRRVRAGGQVSSASVSFPGLRPGRALVGRPVGAGNRVRIEANAEPGP